MDFRKWGTSILRAARQLARVPIIVSCFGVALLAGVAAGGVGPGIGLAFIIIVLLIIHGNGTNDLSDYEIDRVNLKGAHDRPLVSGDVSRQQLWWLQGVCGLFAIGLSWVLGPMATLATAGVALYNYLYSFQPLRITDRTILSPLTLAAAYTFQPFTLGYAAAGHDVHYPWMLAMAIYFGFVSRLLLKDFRDVEGDAKFGKQTFLLRYGARATCLFSGLAALISLGFAAVAVTLSDGVLTALIIGNVGVLLLLTDLSHEQQTPEQLRLISLIAKLANTSLLALLVYYLCGLLLPSQPAADVVLPVTVAALLFVMIYRGGYRAAQS